MSRGHRARLEENIFRDRCGVAAKLQVGDYYREQRFPPDIEIEEVRRWLTRTRAELQALPGAHRDRTARGTLAQDAVRYEKHVAHLVSWRERRSEVRAWVALYGTWRRRKIKRDQVVEARTKWLAAGKKPKTINNRVATLAHLFRTLDGRKAPTPCDEIEPLEVKRAPAKLVAGDIVVKVHDALLEQERIGKLRDSRTRARFMVIAASGRRPSEVMRAEPDDVDLANRTWRVRDGKGGFTPGGLYLHDDLLTAWQVFIAAKAWGHFRVGAFDRVLRNAGWPKGVRPYQLRHSVGIALSESGADLADIGAWMGHIRSETTRKHYVPILSGRMRALGEALGKRIGWPATAGQSVRAPRPKDEKAS